MPDSIRGEIMISRVSSNVKITILPPPHLNGLFASKIEGEGRHRANQLLKSTAKEAVAQTFLYNNPDFHEYWGHLLR